MTDSEAGKSQCTEDRLQIKHIEWKPRAATAGKPGGEDAKVSLELDMVYASTDSASRSAKDMLDLMTSGQLKRDMTQPNQVDQMGDTAAFWNQKGMDDVKGDGAADARKYAPHTDEVYGIMCGNGATGEKQCVTWHMEKETGGSGTTPGMSGSAVGRL